LIHFYKREENVVLFDCRQESYTRLGVAVALQLDQAVMIFSVLIGSSYYLKKHKWSVIKSRKIIYTPENSSS